MQKNLLYAATESGTNDTEAFFSVFRILANCCLSFCGSSLEKIGYEESVAKRTGKMDVEIVKVVIGWETHRFLRDQEDIKRIAIKYVQLVNSLNLGHSQQNVGVDHDGIVTVEHVTLNDLAENDDECMMLKAELDVIHQRIIDAKEGRNLVPTGYAVVVLNTQKKHRAALEMWGEPWVSFYSKCSGWTCFNVIEEN